MIRIFHSLPSSRAEPVGETNAWPTAIAKVLNSARLIGVIGAWIERRRQQTVLAQLDDRLLRDIGLTRSQDGVKPLSFAGRA